MKAYLIGIFLALAAVAPASQALAKHTRAKPKPQPWYAKPVERDCTPINGRYGYYGNPWCDTGSTRPPDMRFRDRYRNGYR
ncbi:hypothetical protein [Hyphomicrobium facile]|uniref:Uncharacterized protein n=1 Tax=Hyphomicrobium facile TaxID=51670 RepID=A0A1I7NPX2_9HYPH|nr:hypothetical protein [Hyphomicrobium facile]SFV36689.1 hypothetical protein SAMN04488557_2670 [Hyphomicrobium facile]